MKYNEELHAICIIMHVFVTSLVHAWTTVICTMLRSENAAQITLTPLHGYMLHIRLWWSLVSAVVACWSMIHVF